MSPGRSIASSTSIGVVVQSHRRLARDALCAYLASRPEFDVVGETADVAGLAGLCSRHRPAVVLVEVATLSMEVIEALRGVREANPATEIVVAYTDISPLTFSAAAQAGITALGPSTQGLDAVVRAMRVPGGLDGRATSPTAALTDREMQVMSLLGTGSSVPEIADSLRISPRTVENHKRHIYTKLGVGSASHAVSRATSLGLIDAPTNGASTADPSPRPADPPGGGPTVLVHGPAGAARELVIQALAESGRPFRTPDPGEVAGDAPPGPVMTILVDPGPADWARPAAAPVVVWSAAPDRGTLLDSLRHGAQAVLVAAEVADRLAGVLALVAGGYAALSRAHLTELTDLVTRGAEHPAGGVPELTPREREILDSISQGHTVRQTARALGIATKTVENTQARLFRKLGARNRAGALTIAYRMGIVRPEPPGVV